MDIPSNKFFKTNWLINQAVAVENDWKLNFHHLSMVSIFTDRYADPFTKKITATNDEGEEVEYFDLGLPFFIEHPIFRLNTLHSVRNYLRELVKLKIIELYPDNKKIGSKYDEPICFARWAENYAKFNYTNKIESVGYEYSIKVETQHLLEQNIDISLDQLVIFYTIREVVTDKRIRLQTYRDDNGIVFYLLNCKFIKNRLPMLRSKSDSVIRRHYKSLEIANLLFPNKSNQTLCRMYYGFHPQDGEEVQKVDPKMTKGTSRNDKGLIPKRQRVDPKMTKGTSRNDKGLIPKRQRVDPKMTNKETVYRNSKGNSTRNSIKKMNSDPSLYPSEGSKNTDNVASVSSDATTVKKRKPNYWWTAKELFETAHFELTQGRQRAESESPIFEWTGKEEKQLKNLVTQIKKRITTGEEGSEDHHAQFMTNFSAFLEASIKIKDDFINRNYSPAILYSQFSNICTKYLALQSGTASTVTVSQNHRSRGAMEAAARMAKRRKNMY